MQEKLKTVSTVNIWICNSYIKNQNIVNKLLLFFISLLAALAYFGSVQVFASETTYQSWNIPENAPPATQVVPFGKPYEAINGKIWFLTAATSGHRTLNYLDPITGVVSSPANILYACCTANNPSPQDADQSYFVADSTGKVFYTGADYSVYEITLDGDGNPTSFGTRTWLPPATGFGAFGGSNWGPLYMQIGSDDTFWYVNGSKNIKNTQQDGTLIQEFTVPYVITGMQLDDNGNIWMSTDESATVSIAKLEIATGTFTNYPLDYSKGYNIFLQTIGSDGNIWFIHDNINVIPNPMAVGKITPSGIVSYPAGLYASYIVPGHGNNILLTSRDYDKIQSYDVSTGELNTYGQSSQIGFQMLIKASNLDEYWYFSKHNPKLSSYVGSASYAITKAILDEKNASAIITSPKNSNYITTSTVSVNTLINDPDGLSKVELYVNGELTDTINNPTSTQSISWDTSSLNDGQYNIFIRIYDPSGKTEDSELINIAFDRNTSNGFTPGIDNFILDRPTTNGSLSDIIEGPDKNLWGIYKGNIIFSFDPCTENKAEFSSPLRSGTSASYSTSSRMISGSDGKIYYVDRNNTGISTITSDGTIEQLTNLPTIRQDQPQYGYPSIADIAEDMNGNIWYAAYYDNSVGYIDKTGNSLGQISLSSSPTELTTGSDGSIWVAYGTGTNARISKINPNTLQLTTYTPPTSIPQFGDLFLGQDGNIWFSVRYLATDYIGKITNDGVFTTYNLPTGKRPTKLTSDQNGNIWFTISSPYGIGYVDTTDGTVKEYFDSINLNSVYNITSGSDGSLWYSKTSFGSSIGRINLGTDVDCTPPTVQITSPINNSQTKNSSLQISITSSDNKKVEKLEIYQNSLLISTINNPAPTETYSLSTSSLADGNYVFTVVAVDELNNMTTSSPVNVRLDKTKPSIAITSPSSGSVITGVATISATASDANGIASVQFRVNGNSYSGTDTTSPYSISWDTVSFANGNYTLGAIATDNAGNIKESSTISITINNILDDKKIDICHFPNNNGGRTISVSQSGSEEHLNHGDYLGRCLPPTVVARNTSTSLNTLEELEEIDVVRQFDNNVVGTIDQDVDLSTVNVELQDEETLIVNGAVGSINVNSGGTIKGSGRVKSLFVATGAYLAPGQSPGCLTSEGLILEGTYTFELGGSAACLEHDQVIVNGTVKIDGYLEIVLGSNYVPEIDQSFIIISNDGTEAIGSTFKDVTEGSTITKDGIGYTVSYIGGDGNDVELSVKSVAKSEINDEIIRVDESSSNYTPIIIILITISVIALPIVIIRNKK